MAPGDATPAPQLENRQTQDEQRPTQAPGTDPNEQRAASTGGPLHSAPLPLKFLVLGLGVLVGRDGLQAGLLPAVGAAF
jgi:hypothetical protein